MNQLVTAVSQLSARLPSFPCRVLAYRESVPTGLCGSYVSLSGEKTEHIVGLLSHPLGWEALSRALDHDLPLPESRGLVEGACEVEVALVVGGHGHDGAVTVVGQHVVGGPDRQPLAVDRVDRVAVEEHAGLRAVGALALDVGLALDAPD